MHVPAALALDGATLDAGAVLVSLDGENDLVDHVARALVVDDAARAELGDCEEARTGEELVHTPLLATAGQESRQRKAWEVVPWKEALAREVAIAVEVGVRRRRSLEEQPKLGLGLGA